MFEKDKYGYPLENCDVVITLKDNQIFRCKYYPSIGFMTYYGMMIWKENVLSYKIIKEKIMFEKEAEEYEGRKHYRYEDNDYCGDIADGIIQAFQQGAEFGYNKAKEWHYVKDGDLPNTETKKYIYTRRRKRYERQFTNYRVIKCFVLFLSETGKITTGVGYFDCNQKCFLDEAKGMVYAWKEIVLPKEIK